MSQNQGGARLRNGRLRLSSGLHTHHKHIYTHTHARTLHTHMLKFQRCIRPQKPVNLRKQKNEDNTAREKQQADKPDGNSLVSRLSSGPAFYHGAKFRCESSAIPRACRMQLQMVSSRSAGQVLREDWRAASHCCLLQHGRGG